MGLTERYREIESVTKYSNYYLGKFYTWLSIPITDCAARLRLHPNVMTLVSFVLALVGCFFFAKGEQRALDFGAILLYVSYVLDWCDGQLARYTGKMSPFGGWLDQMCDRIKEFAYVSTLAVGAFRIHHDYHVFVWALAALFFLFLLEYYGQMNRAIPTSKSTAEAEAAPTTPQLGKPTGQRRRVVIDFSIDEQYFFILLCIVCFGATWALIGTVVVAALFAVYKPMRAWQRYFSMK